MTLRCSQWWAPIPCHPSGGRVKAELLVRASIVPLLWQMLRPYSTGSVFLWLFHQQDVLVSPKTFLSEEEHIFLYVAPMLESER